LIRTGGGGGGGGIEPLARGGGGGGGGGERRFGDGFGATGVFVVGGGGGGLAGAANAVVSVNERRSTIFPPVSENESAFVFGEPPTTGSVRATRGSSAKENALWFSFSFSFSSPAGGDPRVSSARRSPKTRAADITRASSERRADAYASSSDTTR